MSSPTEAGNQPFVRARQAEQAYKLRPSRRLAGIFSLVDFEIEAKKLLPHSIFSRSYRVSGW